MTGAFGYERERGRFLLFGAKAVILATGGIGRAYRITSNSWEGTGDGHALAYRAGASLIDMEFVQFHPTGMVWPPSVQGILVTEGVRGEGGVLRNSKGERFMFGDIPDNYKKQTADNEEEGWRYTQGDKNARRPPELLTRDHVARCINRELKAGRGSPHGGVFLDISWIKEKLPNAEEHIKRKLPSMYHQFKQLADIDITKEPMEVGPTTHYIMGGVQVDADTQMSTIDGPVCGRRVRLGHQRRQPAGRQLAVRHRRLRQARRRVRRAVCRGRTRPGRCSESQVEAITKTALAPFDRGANAEIPYKVQQELQATMQDLVGIVRTRQRDARSAGAAGRLQRARRARRRDRPPRVPLGLAHGARPAQPADGVRSHHAIGARAHREPRRPLPRRLPRAAPGVGHAQRQGRARRRRQRCR